MIKLIASDLDGTIIDKTNSVCQNNLDAINSIHKKEIPFAICTGKTFPIIKNSISMFNASFGIFGNGNQIIDFRTGKELYRKLLTMDDIELCYKVAKKYNMHVHVYTDTEVITEELLYMDLRNFKLKETKYYENSLEFKVTDNVLEYIKNNDSSVFQFIISSIDNNLHAAETELKDLSDLTVCKISKSGSYRDNIIDKEYSYLNITPHGINKKQALDILKEHLKVEDSEIMAIGDNLNDLEMVKSFGVGVAVANAYNEIKEVAKYTTTNDAANGGFAEAVHKFIEF